MKSISAMSTFFIASSIATLMAWVSSYTNPISIKGFHMYDAKTGEYFHIKGVDYYPRPNAGELNVNNYDFFTDEHEAVWLADVEHLAAANINAIRLYAVDPSKSHDKFMCALRARGIYVLVDLGSSCENCAITKDDSPTCYPKLLTVRGEQIIAAFSKYDNVLAFSAGNEVNHVVSNPTTNAPCQKKFLRDMRAYISRCSSSIRRIPVGVVLADTHRLDNLLYYNCRTDPNDLLENAEWYGLNVYLHCDGKVSTVEEATGFNMLLSEMKSVNPSIPVVLTEFGCLNPSFPTVDNFKAQRNFLQAKWLATESFQEIFAGGFAFEYSTEKVNTDSKLPYPFTEYDPGNYGLGYLFPSTCDHKNVPCKYIPMPNYHSLADSYKTIDTSQYVKLDDFIVPKYRSAIPICPNKFPQLSEFEWESDNNIGLECPSAKVHEFVCPGQQSSGSWIPQGGSDNSNSSQSSNSALDDSNSGSTKTNATTGNGETSAASTRDIKYAICLVILIFAAI